MFLSAIVMMKNRRASKCFSPLKRFLYKKVFPTQLCLLTVKFQKIISNHMEFDVNSLRLNVKVLFIH